MKMLCEVRNVRSHFSYSRTSDDVSESHCRPIIWSTFISVIQEIWVQIFYIFVDLGITFLDTVVPVNIVKGGYK